MRPIPLFEVERRLTAQWKHRAECAAQAVGAVAAGERAAAINKHNAVWGELKDILRELSGGKCWYCESIDDRSDNAVDHFRPKNRVKEMPEPPANEGYWWLAFAWDNYRFSCTFCNSARRTARTAGGKQDRFPIIDETKRARDPRDVLDDETPILIDPTQPADVVLLTFDPDGMAVPAYSETDDPIAYDRARQSIAIYHLNHPTIVERRARVMAYIRYAVMRADQFSSKIDRSAYKEKVLEIWTAMQQGAEYSRAARMQVRLLERASGTAQVLGSS